MQSAELATEFWKKYTDRNLMTVTELDALYTELYGVTRTEMNMDFVADMDRGMSVLEVGCGTGLQMEFLRGMGFKILLGVEGLDYASRIALANGFDVFTCDASELPFGNDDFDMVYTSGLLIHIPPDKLPTAMNEVHRCSRKWIWGLEYYEDRMTPIEYRNDICWKADYVSMFLEQFSDLRLVKEERYPRNRGNVDTMYLLEKK